MERQSESKWSKMRRFAHWSFQSTISFISVFRCIPEKRSHFVESIKKAQNQADLLTYLLQISAAAKKK